MRCHRTLTPFVAAVVFVFHPDVPEAARGHAPAETAASGAAADTFPIGQVIDSVVSVADPTQTYALYLPSKYDPGQSWPVMYLMDPRGRALVPMELFKEAADRHGWILMSSYDTASDGPVEPNEIALDAMLGDTQRLLAPNMNRLYLCGFSGTARVGWMFAVSLAGHVAGMIGVGGGLPSGGVGPGYPSVLAGGPFSFFAAAGNTDFNYEEMQRLDAMLAKLDVPHRLALFEGPHTWLPKEMADRGVDWLEIRAMKDGLRPVDPTLVDEIFTRWLEEARDLEDQGRLLAAAEAYRAVVDDFVSLVPLTRLSEASDRANELERSGEVKALVEKRRETAEAEREFGKELSEKLQKLRSSGSPAKESEKMIQDLKLDEIRLRAVSEADTADALVAQRMIETTFVQTIYYVPRDFIETDHKRALASLTVARAAKPESPRVCYQEARVFAAAERTEEALDALECLVDAGVVRDADFLENEQYLRTLAGEARFAELMERVRSMAAESAAAEQEGS